MGQQGGDEQQKPKAQRQVASFTVEGTRAALTERDGKTAEVYQQETVSTALNSPRRLIHAGRNAKEIMIPLISVTELGDYTRNVGYKTGSIDFSYETKTFAYDCGIKLLADVMDIEEAGVIGCFVQTGAGLQYMQVAPRPTPTPSRVSRVTQA